MLMNSFLKPFGQLPQWFKILRSVRIFPGRPNLTHCRQRPLLFFSSRISAASVFVLVIYNTCIMEDVVEHHTDKSVSEPNAPTARSTPCAGAPPLRCFFGALLARRCAAEMSIATRYTLLCNMASIKKA